MAQSVIVGTGLTNRKLGTERQFLSGAEHVGGREATRLLGEGPRQGKGPLPTLLSQASSEPSVGVVLLTALGQGVDGALVEPIATSAPDAMVVPVPERLPWHDLDELLTVEWPEAHRFLVVGCDTEHEVTAAASMLQSLRPGASVAVSRHLAATTTPDAHFASLRHTLPIRGIEVLLDFDEVASFLEMPSATFTPFGQGGCPVEPKEACEMLGGVRSRIVQSVCMHWTRTRLRPLGGGFSGSALFIAEGWKGDALTEPMVVKIDSVEQMRKELDGYHQVKDLLGKHIPTFGYPVRMDGMLGVGMELAAMEGRPETLQESFEAASTEDAFSTFTRRLERALEMLVDRLYRNTSTRAWVVPYRTFGMHTEDQQRWLQENAEYILDYLGSDHRTMVQPERLRQLLKVVGSNPDGLAGPVGVVHGDLNYANVISDAGDNLWFIDWTLSRSAPIEMDFAKLENDVKFVISKDFELTELDRLRAFEDYLLSNPLPGDVDELPDSLRYVRWDLRYRKILSTVRLIRQACADLRGDGAWLVYRIALLRYATHTLSWDLQRDRGECDVPQLAYALYSVETLLLDLAVDDFHLKIRAERAKGYPERQRIAIDEAPWAVPCPTYDPPYHVTVPVLEADDSATPGGWADPEDVGAVGDRFALLSPESRDAMGRPLNPRGRTGIAGRGSLGRWGANRSVSVVPVRNSPSSGQLEILLGSVGRGGLEISKGFLHKDEAPVDTARRVMRIEAGWTEPFDLGPTVFDGYIYDPRQTDHAWIETTAFLLEVDPNRQVDGSDPSNPFQDIDWWPLEADTINRVPAVQAALVREAVRQLAESGRMDEKDAARLLAATG
jgi:ADP-ribose pyrophosphatase